MMEEMPETLDELNLSRDGHGKFLMRCPHCDKAATICQTRMCEHMPWHAWREEMGK